MLSFVNIIHPTKCVHAVQCTHFTRCAKAHPLIFITYKKKTERKREQCERADEWTKCACRNAMRKSNFIHKKNRLSKLQMRAKVKLNSMEKVYLKTLSKNTYTHTHKHKYNGTLHCWNQFRANERLNQTIRTVVHLSMCA